MMVIRERLIELLSDAEREHLNYEMANKFCPFDEYKCHSEYIADYLIENGVVVLPCKVGDILWFLDYDLPKCFICPEQIVIQDIVLLKNTMLIRCSSSITLRTEDFGKTVFLTKEDAERALRKEDEGK